MLDASALAPRFDSLLIDLDGVVYVGKQAVPGAAGTLRDLADAGLPLCYVTNNASRTPEQVAEHLAAFGVSTDAGSVLTSAQAGAGLVAGQVPAGATVLAVGGPGVAAALRETGLAAVDAVTDPVGAGGDDVAAVLQGFGPDVGWRALARAAFALQRGIPWIATNTDLTIPVEAGIAPGNGTLVAAVAAAAGRQPDVAGKPYPPLLLGAAERMHGQRPLVIGDRLDTDIEGAHNAGMVSLLVLSGVTGTLALWRAPLPQRPDFLASDITGLLQPPLHAETERAGVVRAGSARAWLEGDRLAVDDGGEPLAAVWAAAHLLWQADTRPENEEHLARQLDEALAGRQD